MAPVKLYHNANKLIYNKTSVLVNIAESFKSIIKLDITLLMF
jgi:hypothetical protein